MKKSEKRRTWEYLAAQSVANIAVLATVAGVGIHAAQDSAAARVLIALTACGVLINIAGKALVVRRVSAMVYWYESILDNIPFMLHATDMDMNWIFMNRATEQFLKLDRDAVMGKHCSNWNAVICNTDRCSACCLRNGNPTTFFQQNGMELRVDTNWLLDKKKRRIGYVEVVQNIDSMVEVQNRQTELVENISAICGTFVSASQEISSIAQSLAQASSEQAVSVDDLSKAITQVAEEIHENMERSERAVRFADSIQQDAEQGNRQMDEMTQAVREIAKVSKSIRHVMRAIDQVAFQTNMLSLNASVEAARAGQYGKGFSVVADEVRILAAKSAEASSDTGQLIGDAISKIENGAKIVLETASYFERIIESISESRQIIERICDSTRQQDVSISNIDTGIEKVSIVIQQNSATAQQSAAASEETYSQTVTLRKLLEDFDAFIEATGKETGRDRGGPVKSVEAAERLEAGAAQTGMAVSPQAAGEIYL